DVPCPSMWARGVAPQEFAPVGAPNLAHPARSRGRSATVLQHAWARVCRAPAARSSAGLLKRRVRGRPARPRPIRNLARLAQELDRLFDQIEKIKRFGPPSITLT